MRCSCWEYRECRDFQSGSNFQYCCIKDRWKKHYCRQKDHCYRHHRCSECSQYFHMSNADKSHWYECDDPCRHNFLRQVSSLDRKHSQNRGLCSLSTGSNLCWYIDCKYSQLCFQCANRRKQSDTIQWSGWNSYKGLDIPKSSYKIYRSNSN